MFLSLAVFLPSLRNSIKLSKRYEKHGTILTVNTPEPPEEVAKKS